MNDLISVIVPVYNVEKYLRVCVTSICRQTYQYLEIILVDDGSDDGSGKLCDQLAESDKRIIVIHRKNGGLSAARNSGLDIASGNYIVFVDSDDMIHPSMIEILYQNTNIHTVDISICSYKYIEEGACYEDIENKRLEQSKENIMTGRECFKAFYDNTMRVDMVVMWNKLYKKEMFETIRFPEGKIHEDEYVNYRILYPMNKCFYTDLQLYYYRQRSSSIMGDVKTGKKFEQHCLCVMGFWQERIRFFHEKEDLELYGIVSLTLQRMLIFYYMEIKEEFPDNKALIRYLQKVHFKNYRDNIIWNGKISVLNKLRGLLFLLNKSLYKILWNLRQKKEVYDGTIHHPHKIQPKPVRHQLP